MFFLAECYRQLRAHFSSPDLFHPFSLADYFIDKSLIFARNNLNDDEYHLFRRMFTIMGNVLPKPDLVVYLHQEVDQLQENIAKRKRPYEQSIPNDHLLSVEKSYFDHFKQVRDFPIVIVDALDIDPLGREEDLGKLLDLMDEPHENGVRTVVL